MKAQRNRNHSGYVGRITLSLAFVVLWMGCASTAVHAQALRKDLAFEPVTTSVRVPVTSSVALAELSSMDLSSMSRAWWKTVRKDHIRLLGSSDEQLKEQALKNLIFFAKMYRDQVDLTRAVPRLYKVYRHDANEDHRIMALSALAIIGTRNIFELLREDVQHERSERVRRYTLHALADYYKNQAG